MNAVLVSAASIWEIEITRALGRLDAGDADFVAELKVNDFGELPVRAAHASIAAQLPSHHTDSFDRMLIAQVQAEGLVCVTVDPIFDAYGVATLW